jgi:hypothetical protein
MVEMNDNHRLTGAPTRGAESSRPPIASENVSDQENRRGPLTLVFEVGRLLFSIGILAFGIEHLVFAGAGASNMYPWILGSPAWNYAFGALLIALSASIGIKKRVSLATSVLGTILCLYGLVLYMPRMFTHLRDPGPWTDIVSLGSPLSAACELLAMGGAAWVLAGTGARNMEWMARLGRLLFAATLVAFGAQHFLYSAFLATLIPSWIPWHLFWEDLVGAAFVAAAAAIATNKAARLAALLLGTMFALFVLVLHVPRVIAAVGSRDQWTSGLVAVAMSAGSFILSGASKRSTEGRAPARGTTA